MTLEALVVASAVVLGAAVPSDQAKAAFERGEKAFAADRLDEAAAAYREAAAATPGYAAALDGTGRVLFKQGKRDEAIVHFKAAIEADPQFKLASFNLGFAARKSSDFATAAKAYERYTQLDPNDPDGFYGLGESYRQLGDAPRAITAYEQYLAREKRPSEAKFVERAKEYVATLKAQPAGAAAPPAAAPPSAPAEAMAARVSNPALASARITDGDRLMQDRRYREAAFAYQDAVNADPDSVQALFNLGRVDAVLGYYGQAVARWKHVAELTSDPAIKKSAQDNIAKAQAKIAELGGGSPQSQGNPTGSGPIADTTRERARQAYEQGVRQINDRDYNAALQSMGQAIQLEPPLAVAYVARGSANIGLRRYAEAAVDYHHALRLDGRMASPLYGLGEAYRGMGRPADARTYYERYATSTASDVRPELQAEARKKMEKLR